MKRFIPNSPFLMFLLLCFASPVCAQDSRGSAAPGIMNVGITDSLGNGITSTSHALNVYFGGGGSGPGDSRGSFGTKLNVGITDSAGNALSSTSNALNVYCIGGCSGGGGGVTSVGSGTGLTGGPITSTGTLSIAASYVLPQACNTNQIAQWNGSSWANCLTLAAVATSGSASDLSTGTLPAARLPNPSASTLGGIESFVAQSHEWINAISTSGAPAATQPASSDLSDYGSISNAALANSSITFSCAAPLSCGGSASLGGTESFSFTGIPAAGVVKSTGSAFADAASTDIVALWASGSCSGFLKNDGTCGSGGGSVYTLQVGGSGLTAGDTVNFNNSTPAAGSNAINVTFQTSKASTTDSVSAEIVGDANATHFLSGAGTWTTPSGSGGTVSVVSSGNLTSTALVTGGGTQYVQTPSTTSTLDGSGNLAVAAGGSIGSADTGTPKFTFATSKATFNQSLYLGTTANQLVLGTTTNLTTLTFPAPSGAATLTFPNTTNYMLGAASDTTTTHVLHATAGAGVGSFGAIGTGDLPGSGSTAVNGATCLLGGACSINTGSTVHGVALNEGTSLAIGSTAVGATNTALLGNTGADPSFGAVPLASLATQAADTVVFNATGGSAAPTAVAMPTGGTNGCAGDSNALIYNTTTHAWGCNSILVSTLVGTASDVTGQSSSQSAVTLATSPTAGAYRVSLYADLSTPCTTGSNSVTFTVNWTDGTNARSATVGPLTLAAAQATSTFVSSEIPVYVGSGNVTYASTVSGTCSTGTSAYDVHASLRTP